MEPSGKIGKNMCNAELKRAAEAGDGAAAFQLARFYMKTTEELDKALIWAEKGADLGNTKAMYLCAKLSFSENIVKTCGWLNEGAKRGDEKCMLALGDYNRKGVWDKKRETFLVAPDLNRANTWYQLASNLGSVKAKIRLGDMAVKFSCYKDAMQWYKDASGSKPGSQKDKAKALCRIGDLFRKGLGVKANSDLARSHYQRALDGGYLKARAKLDAMDHKIKHFLKETWDYFCESEKSSSSSESSE